MSDFIGKEKKEITKKKSNLNFHAKKSQNLQKVNVNFCQKILQIEARM